MGPNRNRAQEIAVFGSRAGSRENVRWFSFTPRPHADAQRSQPTTSRTI